MNQDAYKYVLKEEKINQNLKTKEKSKIIFQKYLNYGIVYVKIK